MALNKIKILYIMLFLFMASKLLFLKVTVLILLSSSHNGTLESFVIFY